jgi:hypothetical protein
MGFIFEEDTKTVNNNFSIKIKTNYNHLLFNSKIRSVIHDKGYLKVKIGVDTDKKLIALLFSTDEESEGKYVVTRRGMIPGHPVELVSASFLCNQITSKDKLKCQNYNGYSSWFELISTEDDQMTFYYGDDIVKEDDNIDTDI